MILTSAAPKGTQEKRQLLKRPHSTPCRSSTTFPISCLIVRAGVQDIQPTSQHRANSAKANCFSFCLAKNLLHCKPPLCHCSAHVIRSDLAFSAEEWRSSGVRATPRHPA